MKLEISPVAQDDIRAIYAYSKQQWGAARARLYIEEMRARMRALARREITGQNADDIRPGLRRLVSGSHILWFRLNETQLLVIRVLHQSRDAGRWMG